MIFCIACNNRRLAVVQRDTYFFSRYEQWNARPASSQPKQLFNEVMEYLKSDLEDHGNDGQVFKKLWSLGSSGFYHGCSIDKALLT